QLVFDDARLPGGGRGDHPGLLQLLEPLRQQRRRHQRYPAPQLVEPGGPAQKLAQHQGRPARADDLRSHRNGAELAVAGLVACLLADPTNHVLSPMLGAGPRDTSARPATASTDTVSERARFASEAHRSASARQAMAVFSAV